MSRRGAAQTPELTLEQLCAELNRVKYRRRFRRTLLSTVLVLAVVAALALSASYLWLPVMRIHGSSMENTLMDGDIVVAVKGMDVAAGDLLAFDFNGKLLMKRVIAQGGDVVNIDAAGRVFVNGTALDEPYALEPALGDCDVELPFRVPEGRLFVMGDHRSTSVDSRNSEIGCVRKDQIVGRVALRVWPLERLHLFLSEDQ